MGGLNANLRSRFSIYGRDLPPTFWFLWFGTVINRLGGFAVPFLIREALQQLVRFYLVERAAALWAGDWVIFKKQVFGPAP